MRRAIATIFLTLLLTAAAISAQQGNQAIPTASSGSTTGNVSLSVGAKVILANDPKYSLPATGYVSCNPTMTSGSNILTTDTLDPPFTAAMVGWIVMVNSEDCQTFTNSGVNRLPTTSSTITGFTDAHHVTLSGNANGNCSTACQAAWFPADSQPALNAAWNDALAVNACAPLILPVGYYALGSAIVNTTNPTPCALTRTFGLTSEDQVASVYGQGMYATRLVPLPSFDGTTCKTTVSAQVTCFFGSFQNAGPNFRDFTIDGMGFNNPANMSGRVFLQANYSANISNVQFLNFAGSISANTTALAIIGAANAPAVLNNVFCFAGGYNCILATHQITVTGSESFNMGTGLSVSGENNYSAGNSWYVQGVGTTCAVTAGSGILTSVGDVMSNTVGGNQRAALCPQAGAVVSLFGDQLLGGTLNAGTGGAIAFNGAATVNASSTKFTCQGGAGCLFTSGAAGAIVNDNCGNNVGAFTATLTNLTINNCAAEPSISGRCLLASAVSPLACTSSANGKVAVPAATTTYTITTTAVQSGSFITLIPTTDNTGIAGAPSCATVATPFASVTATTAGTSFTFSLPSNAGISCFAWSIR